MISAKRCAARAGALLVVLAAWGCESTDRIAPDGATIDLNASPAQILLGANGKQVGDVTLLATVRSGIGVPLPGQHVRFTTTSGILDPTAGTPVETDGDGNATTILRDTEQNTTVTATSGKATDMLSLTASTCQLATLTLTSTSPLNLESCPDTFALKATARDSRGNGCSGAVILFEFTTTGATIVTGTFDPNPEVTDSDGLATTELTIDEDDCKMKCLSPNNCTGDIRAKVSGGTLTSNTLSINDQV